MVQFLIEFSVNECAIYFLIASKDCKPLRGIYTNIVKDLTAISMLTIDLLTNEFVFLKNATHIFNVVEN